jgi:multicomponent Na+:H+ antiporter subunit D
MRILRKRRRRRPPPMDISGLPPFLIFFISAMLAAVTRGHLRGAILLLAPVVGFFNLLGLDQGIYWQIPFLDYLLTLGRIDKLSLLFGYLFHLAALLGVIYSLHVKDTAQHVAGLLYAGSALGAVFAGDLLTLFLFCEVLAVSSVFLIWARRTDRAYRVGMRYLIIQLAAGVILMFGVVARLHETGSLEFDDIGLVGLSGWLIFIAFGIKSAFPLLHNWLTDAYPEATPTGTVFLSAFTTKMAVYIFARSYAGTEFLVYIGTAMAMFPIFFAVIENDLRRVLAYSLINQVGFMVCGIGLGTEMALNGAVSHAFNDVIFKGLLFMTMGAVLFRTGEMRGSHLGGLVKSMPWTAGFCVVGAASISAFPLFSGFVSKSMVMVAALDEGYPVVWLGLLFASAGVFHHAGIKIPFFAFFAHDAGHRVKEAPLNMLIAMGLAAAICIFNGSYPWVLYSLLPWEVNYDPYDASHVIAQTQLLFFSALAFTWLKLSGLYPPELPGVNLDTDWFYRRLGNRVVRLLTEATVTFNTQVFGGFKVLVRGFTDWVFRHHGPEGIMSRSVTVGNMVQWMALLLGIYLLLFMIQW